MNVPRKRVLAIGLDGFEISLATQLMAQGRMPHLAALRERSARYDLEHGQAKYTGLAWEHVSTARTPEALHRHSALMFDPDSYHIRQMATDTTPVFANLSARSVLFDVPYCDLKRAPLVRGIASWGAHDPGAPASCNPATLTAEITERFGPALAEAVRVRARAAEWILTERLPDWDFAMVVVSEPHSAIEPLWHGVDVSHPLHVLPSAGPAREGLEFVYIETDALIGRLSAATPDAVIVVFAMHGMGSNGADVAAMALLPELLFQRQFGKSWLRDLPWQAVLPDGTPLLTEDQAWHFAMEDRVPPLWTDPIREVLAARVGREHARIENEEIDWQPASRYRPFWPDMEAFALPSFYDGRVRLNVIGRERYGNVSPNRTNELLQEVREILLACCDTASGLPVVAGFRENDAPIESIGPTEADLYIYWNGLPVGFDHPTLGRIGPLPFRRTGGHSGPLGFLYCAGGGLPIGDHGMRSSFDVVPSLLAILGEKFTAHEVSGKSFML